MAERKLKMSVKEEYEQKTEELVFPVLEESGFELVDVEYIKEAGNSYLRVYIDKPGGITIGDCESVSRRFSEILDEEDYIAGSYIFEVSSPGLLRPLKKDKDFKRKLGEKVEIKTYKTVGGQKEFAGILKSYDTDTVTIECSDASFMTFKRNEAALIRPALDF